VPTVHPIVGARGLYQLQDNLGALDIKLTPEATFKLETAATFDVGFPHGVIRGMQSFVYGDVAAQVDATRRML
jgi:hypothetical protein